MGRKPKQIYTATGKDMKIITEWLQSNDSKDSEGLTIEILDFFLKWKLEYGSKKDSIFHNSIYWILKAIGMNPKTIIETKKDKQNVKQKTTKSSR